MGSAQDWLWMTGRRRSNIDGGDGERKWEKKRIRHGATGGQDGGRMMRAVRRATGRTAPPTNQRSRTPGRGPCARAQEKHSKRPGGSIHCAACGDAGEPDPQQPVRALVLDGGEEFMSPPLFRRWASDGGGDSASAI